VTQNDVKGIWGDMDGTKQREAKLQDTPQPIATLTDEELLASFDGPGVAQLHAEYTKRQGIEQFGVTQVLPAGTPPIAEQLAPKSRRQPKTKPLTNVLGTPLRKLTDEEWKELRSLVGMPPVLAEPDWTWRTRRMDALMAGLTGFDVHYGECLSDFERLQTNRIDAIDEQRRAKRTMEQLRDDVLLSGVIDGKNEAIRSAQLDAALARNDAYRLAEEEFHQTEQRVSVAEMGTTIVLKRIKAMEMEHQLLVAQLEVLAR
jgi:hypothetical protein